MRKYNELPSQEYLIECFEYNPETGELKWKQSPLYHFKSIANYNRVNNKFANTVCGYIDKKYWKVQLDGKGFLIHRIIWKLMMGN